MKLWLLRTACLSFFVALAGCSPQFAGIESSVDRNGEEIARMLAGANVTEEARAAATSLLAGGPE